MSELPLSLEQDLFDRKNQALDYIRQGTQTDPFTAARVVGISSTWNDIAPGVSVALAKSGFDQYSPETKQVAQLATQQKMTTQMWRQQFQSIKTLKDFNTQYGHLTPDEYNALPANEQHALHQRANRRPADGAGCA